MSRLTGLFIFVFCFTSTAEATTEVRKAALPRPDTASIQPATKTRAPDASFKLTTDSEVLLNGKPCSYRDIPKNATVIRIEVSEDRRTILRIEFRVNK